MSTPKNFKTEVLDGINTQIMDKSQNVTRIVILTGDETRHQYFRLKIAIDNRLKVLATYCESEKRA